MSNIVTLASIQAAAEKKFGSTVIDLGETTVELLNPLRLTKTKRDALSKIGDRLREGVDQETVLAEALTDVAKTPAQGKALIKAIGGDLAVLLSTFEAYTSEVGSGEASSSES